MTRMIMYKPLKLLYLITKAVAVAFLIRVLSKYFFDFTLIESDLIFGINIAVTSGIIYFLSPFIYSFLGKNKIRTILVFMLLCFLVKSLFVIVDGSLNNIAILNIDLAGPIVNYIIIFVESIPLIANCGILSDLVHSIIEFIEWKLNICKLPMLGDSEKTRDIHMSNSSSNPSANIGSSSSGPQINSEDPEIKRERSPTRSESPVIVGERGVNPNLPEVQVDDNGGFYRTVQSPLRYTITKGSEIVTDYRPNGGNQPYACSIANAIEDFQKNRGGGRQIPELDNRAQAFFDNFLTHNFPNKNWERAYKGSKEVLKALKRCS